MAQENEEEQNKTNPEVSADELVEENELVEIDNEGSDDLVEVDNTINGDDENKESETNDSSNDDNNEDEDEDEDEEADQQEYAVQKKLGKPQKILIGVVAGLLVVVIIGIILYFVGVFDPDPVESKEQTKITQEIKKEEENKYKFKAKDINEKRLNRKLALLTKYEIIEDEQEEKEKQKELRKESEPVQTISEEKKEDTPQKETASDNLEIEEEIQTKETETSIPVEEKIAEPKKEIIEPEKEIIEPEENIEKLKENIENNQTKPEPVEKEILVKQETPIVTKPKYKGEKFLKFIQVATLKYKLYKSFLDQVKSIDARISVCAYKNNKTQIFIGPFKDDERRDALVEKINATVVNDAFKIEFTQEEFNKRCNF